MKNKIDRQFKKANMINVLQISLIVVIGFLATCQNNKLPTAISASSPFLLPQFDEKSIIEINPDFVPNVQICTWQQNRKAAYTVAFDDARSSHYRISGKELKKRGMVGTFSLNTKDIIEWAPWRKLFNEGNEIASHTWSHCNCTELDEHELRLNLQMAKFQIISNIDGISDVPSFTYPYGLHDEFVRKIVMEYHESARGDGGINGSTLSEEEFSMLKGIGVYRPYDMDALNNLVKETMVQNGWIIVYFHSVNEQEQSMEASIPFSLFTRHLDFVNNTRDSLWIATQCQVVNYIKLRESTHITSKVTDGKIIEVTLSHNSSHFIYGGKLSFILNLPSSWSGSQIVVKYGDMDIGEIISEMSDTLIYDILPGAPLLIFSVKC